ncbi:MAG: phage major capsid protein [Endomicrobium sp.]|jgi:hypothetical protein|nr:phage major capsid protein [Endomicrobium sp.]
MALDLTPSQQIFNDALVTTLPNYTKEVFNNVMTATPLLKFMFDRGKKKTGTGSQIELIIANQENQNAMWTGFGDSLPTSRNEQLVKAVYDWRVLNCTISILHDEILINSEPSKIVSFVSTMLKLQETACKNAMARAIFGKGSSGSSTVPDPMNGLQLLVADDPTTGIVGGIDRSKAANAFWRNQSIKITGADSTKLLDAMNKMILMVSRDAERPSAIVMDNYFYTMFKATLQTIQRIITDKNTGNQGFRTLEFEGIPVIYDPNCPAYHCYFINDDYLFPVVLKGAEFDALKPREAYNQLALLYILHFVGNLVVSDPRRQGVIYQTVTQSQLAEIEAESARRFASDDSNKK